MIIQGGLKKMDMETVLCYFLTYLKLLKDILHVTL